MVNYIWKDNQSIEDAPGVVPIKGKIVESALFDRHFGSVLLTFTDGTAFLIRETGHVGQMRAVLMDKE